MRKFALASFNKNNVIADVQAHLVCGVYGCMSGQAAKFFFAIPTNRGLPYSCIPRSIGLGNKIQKF